jgi:predicted RNA binding protein YcfA (HicA-like mRNA interferase family)
MDRKKLLRKLVSGSKNIRFTDAIAVAEAFGFELDRVSGSHHIFVHPWIPELINLQNVKGKVKPYQVKQLLRIVEKYDLHLEEKS